MSVTVHALNCAQKTWPLWRLSAVRVWTLRLRVCPQRWIQLRPQAAVSRDLRVVAHVDQRFVHVQRPANPTPSFQPQGTKVLQTGAATPVSNQPSSGAFLQNEPHSKQPPRELSRKPEPPKPQQAPGPKSAPRDASQDRGRPVQQRESANSANVEAGARPPEPPSREATATGQPDSRPKPKEVRCFEARARTLSPTQGWGRDV